MVQHDDDKSARAIDSAPLLLMGFAVGHSFSELPLPTFLLCIAMLLLHIRRLLPSAFNVDVRHELPSPPTASASSRSNFTLIYSVPQKLNAAIKDALPVVRYEAAAGDAEPCAVCLSELELGDEVRRLSNCRHVFHRGCLDRWVEHEQSTCPLCRNQLVPDAPDLDSY